MVGCFASAGFLELRWFSEPRDLDSITDGIIMQWSCRGYSPHIDRAILPTMLPREHQALKVESAGVLTLQSVSLPPFQPDQVLIRVQNVGLNPVDAKSTDLSPSPGATVGVDFAGTVVAVGSALSRPWNVGDRVFGGVFGNNPNERENGAFAEYVVAYSDLIWSVPEWMSMDTAACLGVGFMTVGLALYFDMGLRLPRVPGESVDDKIEENGSDHGQFVLVYGGATATGLMAIQMLRLYVALPHIGIRTAGFLDTLSKLTND
jgi:aspyridone synthetase trans-acting enoyl reductase